MKIPNFTEWPVWKQIKSGDPHALGHNTMSARTRALEPRTRKADRVVKSVCPYCAVGCGQLVYVKDERILDIEGDPDSPISRGRLCPKGAATLSLARSPARQYKVKYRRPYANSWEDLELETALDMIADRVIAARDATFEEKSEKGEPLNRTMGIASLGGATLDNEENYLMKKLYTSLGVVQVENQARI